MQVVKDALGNELKVGDVVAFGKRVGNTGRIGSGEITRILGSELELVTKAGRVLGRSGSAVIKAYTSALDDLLFRIASLDK